MSGPVVVVDVEAIRANVREIARVTVTPLLAVVKADAYGHGALAVARAALEGGAERLGVVDLREALALRDGGITAPILTWMHGPGTEWTAALAADVELGISSLAQLELLDIGLGRLEHSDQSVAVHLKLDTGLGRNGVSEIEWEAAFSKAAELERRGVVRLEGLFSHFAGAGDAADRAQLARFERAVALAAARGLSPSVLHLAATAGSLSLPEARFDLVRLGVSLYGLSPFAAGTPCPAELRPALSLSAPILHDDEGFLVEIGHAAGLPPVPSGSLRFADEHGGRWVLRSMGTLESRVEPLVEPSGDEDRAAGGTREGARLLVIDAARSASVDDWAAAAGTINYEVVTRLSQRLPRRYRDSAALVDSAPRHDAVRVAPAPASEGGLRRLAPRRELFVDVELLRSRLGGRASELSAARAAGRSAATTSDDELMERFAVDVSADAYGHGAQRVASLAIEYGLLPLVSSEAELRFIDPELRDRVLVDRRRVQDVGTRLVYAFDDPSEPGALALVSELVHVKRVMAGHGVSYGFDWVAEEPTTLGLVPLGYADAMPRRVAGKAEVVVGGERRPVLGRVAMDQVVIDLQDQEAWIGMPVSVFGAETRDIHLREWASWAGVEPRAFAAALGSRVVRSERHAE